jgi:signal peptidase II
MTDGLLIKQSMFADSKIAVAFGIWMATTVIIIDQLTKTWAVNALDGGRIVHVVSTLQLNLTYNSGMAFSQGQGLGPVIGVLALLIVVVLTLSLRKSNDWRRLLATGLIIGGAVGNIIDRVFRGSGKFHGSVVDFIDLQWWPVFNVADMGVMVGAALLIFSVATPRADKVTPSC